LANGFHFEGWAIINGDSVTTGKFNVDAGGNIVDLSGNVIANGEFDTGVDLSGTIAIVFTIEPAGDTDAIPADTHYLSGSLANLSASLSVGHAAALGDDFTSASGNYILATFTNEDATDENSGIWFLDLFSGSLAQGLNLFTLPAGWNYEGWAVISGTSVTTGTFTNLAAVDDAALYSGTQGGPFFPGEDFLQSAFSGLTFPTDIAGGTAVITIEPSPDDNAAPFTLKPLVGFILSSAADHFTYAMDNNASGFPTGSAIIK